MPRRITLPFKRTFEAGSKNKYPFDQLQIGDQLAIPQARCNRASVYQSALRYMAKNPGVSFLISGRPTALPVDPDYALNDPDYWVVERIAPAVPLSISLPESISPTAETTKTLDPTKITS